jgi:hypothetical protein
MTFDAFESVWKVPDRQHDAVQRIDIARDDRVQRHHDLRGDERGIHRLDAAPPRGRPRPVTTISNSSAEACSGPGRVTISPMRNTRRVVHAINLVDAEPVHQTVIDHRLGPGSAFLGGLEDHHDRSVEIPCLG